jgi:L-asparagine transporter-like permease
MKKNHPVVGANNPKKIIAQKKICIRQMLIMVKSFIYIVTITSWNEATYETNFARMGSTITTLTKIWMSSFDNTHNINLHWQED